MNSENFGDNRSLGQRTASPILLFEAILLYESFEKIVWGTKKSAHSMGWPKRGPETARKAPRHPRKAQEHPEAKGTQGHQPRVPKYTRHSALNCASANA